VFVGGPAAPGFVGMTARSAMNTEDVARMVSSPPRNSGRFYDIFQPRSEVAMIRSLTTQLQASLAVVRGRPRDVALPEISKQEINNWVRT